MSKGLACVLLALTALASAAAQEASVIREILIRGQVRVSKEAILAAMRTKVGQPYLQENLDSDKKSIDSLGFFQSVDVRATPLEQGNWKVTVDVLEFPEIKEIRVTGNSAVTTEEILKAITLKPGDVYNLNSLRPSRDAVQQLYARKGFFADVEDFAPLPDSPSTVNLAILETRVGTVAVQGNTRTKDYVMRRLIKTRSGEVLSLSKWSNDLRRLYNTQWFENVKSQEEEADLGKVNLTADVTETRTGIFNVGIQLDPRNSLAGLIKIQETNFRGTGQGIGLNLLQSTSGGGLSADLDYTNPFIDNRDTTLRASIYSKVNFRFAGSLFGSDTSPTEDDRYIERRTGGSIGFTRPITDFLTVGVSTRLEAILTEDLKIKYVNGEPLPYLQQDGNLLTTTIGATFNRRDTDLDPSRGDWLKVEVEPGYSHINEAGPIGQQPGSSLFLRTNVEYRRYWSDQPARGRNLDAPRRVLALRLRGGTIAGTVPFFEQYFAGGVDTIRGYAEDRYWGNTFLATTLEYRYPIQKSFNVIAFVDYGGAWGGYGSINDFTQSSTFEMHVGYGVGLSFRTPLGPIRLDLGFDENGKSRTHFLIGTAF